MSRAGDLKEKLREKFIPHWRVRETQRIDLEAGLEFYAEGYLQAQADLLAPPQGGKKGRRQAQQLPADPAPAPAPAPDHDRGEV